MSRFAALESSGDESKSGPPDGEEQAWLESKATVASQNFSGYDYLCIVDFECTCSEDNGDKSGKGWNHEIIEFPAVFMNAITGEIDFEFHCYVRPTERPQLTEFCTTLTGIDQATVDASCTLDEALVQFDAFLSDHRLVHEKRRRHEDDRRFVICTDGPWDVQKFLRPEVTRKNLPFAKYWINIVNIRRAFSQVHDCKWCVINDMLEKLGLTFVGRPHSGIDDSRNIAVIAYRLHQMHKLKPNMRVK